MNAKEIMSKEVITVFPESSIEELAKLLTGNNISGVPVVDKDKKVIGIVTEKDILYKGTEPRFPPVAEILGAHVFLGSVKKYNTQLKKVLATSVAELMTEDVITTNEDDDIKKIVELMINNNINRLPVLDSENRLCGIISRTDIVKYMSKTL